MSLCTYVVVVNALYGASGTMKLCDFGLSLSGSTEHVTGGTIAYMPPESLRRQFPDRFDFDNVDGQVLATSTKTASERQEAGFAVDMFAMGIIVWEVRNAFLLTFLILFSRS